MNHFHHVAIQCTQNEGEQGRNNAKGQVACGGIHMRDCDYSWQTDCLSSFPETAQQAQCCRLCFSP